MDDMQQKLSDKFRSHWIKIKFYQKDPRVDEDQVLHGVRFCEAVKSALLKPALLTNESISCPGARYVFGWDDHFNQRSLDGCADKQLLNQKVIESLLPQIPRFEKPFSSIGLNMPGDFDLLISFLSPEQMMSVIMAYHNAFGKKLECSLSSMMSICGGVAVQTILNKDISLSFGCRDSRSYADIGRHRLVAGISKSILGAFVS